MGIHKRVCRGEMIGSIISREIAEKDYRVLNLSLGTLSQYEILSQWSNEIY
jgi:hypothetical protein